MPLTHEFKETVRARAQRDPEFRQALLCEAVQCIIGGDLPTGKAVLRDYVNATLGFANLERQTQIPAKSLMRMLGPAGSPSAANLANILTALQNTEGIRLELSTRRYRLIGPTQRQDNQPSSGSRNSTLSVYATRSCSTLPATSVRRKSRPE